MRIIFTKFQLYRKSNLKASRMLSGTELQLHGETARKRVRLTLQ
jgi:hypothetical protein